MRRVTLVVPCFNEGGRLDSAAFRAFLEATPDAGLVFVDDGSSDATPEVLEALRSTSSDRIDVLTLERNAGKAAAVRRGVLAALARPARYVGFWDADLATPLREVDGFCALLDENPRLEWVIGSRVKLLGRSIQRSAWRHYAGRILATAASLLLRLPVYDTQCGAKVFRVGPGTGDLFRRPFLTRWLFDVELFQRLATYREVELDAADVVYEYPVSEWRDVGDSKLGLRDMLRAPLDLARLAWRWRVRPRFAGHRVGSASFDASAHATSPEAAPSHGPDGVSAPASSVGRGTGVTGGAEDA